MGLFNKIRQLHDRARRRPHASGASLQNKGWRICRFEEMERREMLSAGPSPLNVGLVYYDPHNGTASVGKLFYISWNGGAPGTQLTSLSIDTTDSQPVGDNHGPFFDTAAGAPAGATTPIPATIVSMTGSGSATITAPTGSHKMTIDFTNFVAGDTLVLSVGMDNQKADGSIDGVVDGNEIAGSLVTAVFAAPRYRSATQTGTVVTAFDPEMVGLNLGLPPESYMPPSSTAENVFTAGLGMSLPQVPLPITVSGTVYQDLNLNNVLEAGEPGIPNAQLALYQLDTSTSTYTATGQTTTTDASGNYSFSSLAPGTYQIVETVPTGYLSVGASAGTVSDPTDGIASQPDGAVATNPTTLSDLTLQGGDVSPSNNFGNAKPASISGLVYVDANGSGQYYPSDQLLAGVTISLLDSNGTVVDTTTTNSQGTYSFTGLMTGTYSLQKTPPPGYFDGQDTIGSAGGTLTSADLMSTITLGQGVDGTNYNFAELLPASVSGIVYVDANNSGQYVSGDTLLPGVTITLMDGSLNTVATAKTDANGAYSFAQLQPGVYMVEKTPPQGYFDGQNSVGSAGGALAGPDEITAVSLGSGVAGTNYDFAELLPASVSGVVYVDANNNGQYDSGETLLSGVTVTLLDSTGSVAATTTTNAQGAYSFTGLTPDTYSVQKTPPAGYLDGQDSVGSAGGSIATPDDITSINLGYGATGVNYNFAELLPAAISGYVYVDTNDIGQYVSGDPLLSGVTLTLLDSSGAATSTTTQTDSGGFYQFTNLMPGAYGVQVTQPFGYKAGTNTAGTDGGTAHNPGNSITGVALPQAANGLNYDFGEIKIGNPVPPPVNPPLVPPTDHKEAPFPSPAPLLGEPNPPPLNNYYLLPEPIIPMQMLGGGDLAEGNTWHLSVIDGGQPRSLEDGADGSIAAASTVFFNAASWSGSALNQSQWVLADQDGAPLKQIVFGLAGATPVVGDWNGDGRSKIGIFLDGAWFLDLSGDGTWDDNGLWARLGRAGDLPVTGDWDGDGKTDIGIFGPRWKGDEHALAREPGQPAPYNRIQGRFKNIPPDPADATSGTRMMKRTAHGKLRTDVIDHVYRYGASGDVPVAGDWSGGGVTTVGVFRDGLWYLDMLGNGHWSPGERIVKFGLPGDIPVVGDWTGDGIKKLGVYRNGTWYLDVTNEKTITERTKVVHLGGPNDLPVVGDWTGDGIDKLGIYRDGRVEPPSTQARAVPGKAAAEPAASTAATPAETTRK